MKLKRKKSNGVLCFRVRPIRIPAQPILRLGIMILHLYMRYTNCIVWTNCALQGENTIDVWQKLINEHISQRRRVKVIKVRRVRSNNVRVTCLISTAALHDMIKIWTDMSFTLNGKKVNSKNYRKHL